MAKQVNGSVKGMEPAGLSAVADSVRSESARQELPVADHAALASRHPRSGGIPGPDDPHSLRRETFRLTVPMP